MSTVLPAQQKMVKSVWVVVSAKTGVPFNPTQPSEYIHKAIIAKNQFSIIIITTENEIER